MTDMDTQSSSSVARYDSNLEVNLAVAKKLARLDGNGDTRASLIGMLAAIVVLLGDGLEELKNYAAETGPAGTTQKNGGTTAPGSSFSVKLHPDTVSALSAPVVAQMKTLSDAIGEIKSDHEKMFARLGELASRVTTLETELTITEVAVLEDELAQRKTRRPKRKPQKQA